MLIEGNIHVLFKIENGEESEHEIINVFMDELRGFEEIMSGCG